MKLPYSRRPRLSSPLLLVLLCLLLFLAACRDPHPLPAETAPPPAPIVIPTPAIILLTQPSSSLTPEEIEQPLSPSSPSPSFPFPSIQSITWIDEEYGWALTRDTSRLLLTQDGGLNWRDVTPNDLSTGSMFALDRWSAWSSAGEYDPSSDPSFLYRTRDGGQNWETISVPMHLGTVHFLDPQNGWAVGSSMGCGAGSCFIELGRTSDGGQTWEKLPVNSPYGEQDQFPYTVRVRTGQEFSFSDLETLWLAGSIWANQDHGRNALLWVSRNAGGTWQELRLPLPENAPGPAVPSYVSPPVFLNRGEAYLTAHYSWTDRDEFMHSFLVFFFSSDGGRTWTARPQALETPPHRILVEFVSASDIFALCKSGLCVSKDGALSWQVIDSDLSFDQAKGADLYSLDFVSPMVGWAVVSNQDGGYDLYRTLDGGFSWELLQCG
jgi:photosystem II stability/assembly factor-like uncharacterized protein